MNMSILVRARVRVPAGLQLANAFQHVNDSRNRREHTGDDHDEGERQKSQLQHHPCDRAHLANGRDLSGPARFHFHFVADEIMENDRADEDHRVARDDENGKPDRKFSVGGIVLAPIADAQRDDAAQKESFVRERIENHAQRAALFVTARDVAVQAVADRRDKKNDDRREAHPFLRIVPLDALAVINRHRHERWDHQDPRDGDLVRSGHRELL
jgi:hypothetical protein